MKSVFLAALVCACAAAPQFNPRIDPYGAAAAPPRPYGGYGGYRGQAGGGGLARAGGEGAATVLRSDAQLDEGGYRFAYDTDNGIHAEEAGVEGQGTQAQGSYSYPGPDGQLYTVTYTAGEGGFRAQGAHLPTPPPVPEDIARALQQNARDEAAGIFDDGSYHDTKYSSGVVAARTYQPNAYNPFGTRRLY